MAPPPSHWARYSFNPLLTSYCGPSTIRAGGGGWAHQVHVHCTSRALKSSFKAVGSMSKTVGVHSGSQNV